MTPRLVASISVVCTMYVDRRKQKILFGPLNYITVSVFVHSAACLDGNEWPSGRKLSQAVSVVRVNDQTQRRSQTDALLTFTGWRRRKNETEFVQGKHDWRLTVPCEDGCQMRRHLWVLPNYFKDASRKANRLSLFSVKYFKNTIWMLMLVEEM